MKKVYSRNEITDDQLMNMIQRSDETAFNILYGRYWKALYSFAFSILNDEDVSKDIVQVIWIKFWESRKKIKNQNIRSYLLKMVQNGVYKHLRDNKKFGDRLQLIDDYFSTQNFVDISDVRDSLTELEQKIENLPERNRDIFKLSRFQNISNQVIAEKLGISKRTVENYISGALKVLRKSTLLFF